MPPRSERVQDLVNYAGEELERFRSGETDRLSSRLELSSRFGYKPNTISKYLKKFGLTEERRIVETSNIAETLTPSPDLAWLLGVLAGGGYVKAHEIHVICTNKPLLRTFLFIGERVLQKNGIYTEEVDKVAFYDKRIADSLGEFDKTKWPQTIIEKHQWLLEDSRYLWDFLTAYHERRGSIAEDRKIMFSTPHQQTANFLVNLLVRVGITSPFIKCDRNHKEGVCGVTIHRVEDVRVAVQNMRPRLSEKRQALERCRQRVMHTRRSHIFSDKECILEWVEVRGKLGKAPTYTDLKKLKRVGEIRFCPQVYTNRFGNGSFPVAREKLEDIIAE